MDSQHTPPSTQPKNTAFVGLAREIPEYRQAKLAGQRRVGPIRNIAPSWSNINQIPQNSEIVVPNSAEPTTLKPKSVTLNLQDSPITNELETLKEKLSEKERQLAVALEQNKDEKARYTKVINDNKAAYALIKNLKQQLDNMSLNNEDQNKLAELKNRIQEKEAETAELHAELDDLRAKLSEEQPLVKEIEGYKQQIKTLTAEQQRLHQLVLQENKKIEELSEQLQQQATGQDGQTKYQGMLEQIIQTPQQVQPAPQPSQKNVVQATTVESNNQLPPLTKEKNAVNGIVRDANGKLISNAIIIIKDKANHNLRALKSNQLGQFIATTPLPNGEYFIEVEKQLLTFDLTKIVLAGEILQPILITSHEPSS